MVISSNYELYISQPILVTGKLEDDYSGLVGIYLKGAEDQYTSIETFPDNTNVVDTYFDYDG